MSYQVIARKYRPQSFDQMVGQSHITQTLLNALKNNRLPHALLFTGPRGTGKTSSARILAKALRCTNSKDFVPCDKCQSCLEIASGRSIDVIEIDGASNNGVDAIRDLRDNVMFAPSSGKYKVFIIDEVHMLSTSAFNALLKTLEEPPAHVVFILATTEVHKIPQTILSRCQRFDFRRIPLKNIAEHLKFISKEEGFKADEAALWLIARQGDGSMRDSLSLLDQVISFTNGKLTETEVSQVLGLTERTLIYEVFQNVLTRDPKAMIATLQKLTQSAQNPNLFLEDLSKLIRHSLILKADSSARLLIDLPDDEIELVVKQITDVSDEDLHMLFDITMKSLTDTARAQDPQTVFEISLLRLAQAPRMVDLQSLLQSGIQSGASPAVEKGPERPKPPKPVEEKAVASQSVSATPLKTAQPNQPTVTQSTAPMPTQAKAALTPAAASPAPRSFLKVDADHWLQFVENLRKEDLLTAAKLENLVFVGVEDKTILLQPPMAFGFLENQLKNPELRQKIEGLFDINFGPGYTFEVKKAQADVQGDSAQSLAVKKRAEADEKKKEAWQLDPRVKKAQEVFKGQIKIVKND